MKLDFSEVKELENKLVEEGEQDLTIKGAKEVKSKNGTNMLQIDCEDAEGGFLRDNICLTGAGAFRAQQFFGALGITEEEAVALDASELIGQTFTAVVEWEDYEGKQYAKIKKYIY